MDVTDAPPALTSPSDAPDARRWEAAASVGWAFPLGNAERGARLSDTTYGLVPIAADVAYRATDVVGVGAWLRYGVGVPTLCQTSGECASSLGHDVAVALRARFYLPRLGPLVSHADAGVGYEWFTARLSDGGATSTRSYAGPLLASVSLASAFELSPRFTLGAVVDVALGTFTRSRLETPSFARDEGAKGAALHAWTSLGVELGARF